jgi:hypothetical protein
MGILSSRWQFRDAALQPESLQWGIRKTCSPPSNVVPANRSCSDHFADAALSTYYRRHAIQPSRCLGDTTPRPPSGGKAGISAVPLSVAERHTCLSASADPQHCFVCGLPANESCFGCDEKFCHSHVYSCSDCQIALCADCLDTHHADGHWSDSDTAHAMADSIRGTFNRGCQELNCPGSTASNTTPDRRRSTIQAFALLLSACLFSIGGALLPEASQ